MQRIVIFAHYDKRNLIQDYVIYYLTELKKVTEKIIFVSDGNIPAKELNKISQIVDFSITEKHGEYDFGSYKRGYLYAKESGWLKNTDTLIIANDSCYGPLYPFQCLFEKMQNKNVDFWGITANPKDIYNAPNLHIQSYFVSFNSKVINSEIFDNFMQSIKAESNKNDIILKYEVGLTKQLASAGFSFDVYCESSKHLADSHVLHPDKLLKDDNNIFVKTNLFRYTNVPYKIKPNFNWIKQTNYNIKLIKSDLKYNRNILKKNRPYETQYYKLLNTR